MALSKGILCVAAALLCAHAAASAAAADGGGHCATEAVQAADHVMLQHQRALSSTRDRAAAASTVAPCLCVFDVDRTLTAKQGAEDRCPRSEVVPEIWDTAYGGGRLTLSALGAEGLETTFCQQCYLGVCSAGDAGGEGSAERSYLAEVVLRSGPQDELFEQNQQAKAWSYGSHVTSPFVLGQPDRKKHEAVRKIVRWYRRHGIHIPNDRVHFFGDRTENIMPFHRAGFNAREISCDSRDASIGNGIVGLCGGTPEEIVETPGTQTCEAQGSAAMERQAAGTAEEPAPEANSASGGEPCLCVFDVDRTLTGKQGSSSGECPRNEEVPEIWDTAYGGGPLTLSALGAEGLGNTFCQHCYLGVCSHGDAGGDGSAERSYLAEVVLRSGPQDELFEQNQQAKAWSYGSDVISPFVLRQNDRTKQEAVIRIVSWYAEQGIHIPSDQVHFFGDRTENIMPFQQVGFNAREISCDSRDASIGNGMVGRCGGTPEEIVATPGTQTCRARLSVDSDRLPLDDGPGHNGDGKPLQRCQGDCDQDSDCMGSLVCFQRDGHGEVPGCSGQGTWDFDYCVDASR